MALEFFFMATTALLFVGLAVVIYLLLQILKQLRKVNSSLRRILWLLRKIVVTVPSVTVAVEKPAYDHGDTVNISGVVKVDEAPQEGTSVALTLTDSAGIVTDLGTVVTGADGSYTASTVVPETMAPGSVTVTANALGATATTTFTQQ